MKRSDVFLIIIFAFSWAFFFSKGAHYVLGEGLLNEIIGTICGISLGMYFGYSSVLMVRKIKFRNKNKE